MASIKINHVAQIEGHAKLRLHVENHELLDLGLDIVEGARFFENILKEKKYNELPLITARICGVCSPAHTIAAIEAIEDAFGIEPDRQTTLLRELLTIGGLVQSHVLHLYFLVLPEYAGFDSALRMRLQGSTDKQEEIERALRIKRVGNLIVTTIGGRDIHPLTAVVGGFSKLPSKESLNTLSEELKAVEEDALKTCKLFSSLSFPQFEHQSTYLGLHGNRLLGDTISYLKNGKPQHFPHDYEEYIKEYFQHDSTGEFVIIEGKPYTVGPQARMNVNWELLDEDLKSLLNINYPFYSPFANIPFQAVEIISSLRRAGEIIGELLESSLEPKPLPEITPAPATGIGVVEAPRGLLFHKYTFDEDGYCTYANVTTPTSQNLRMIEECLTAFVMDRLHLPQEELVNEVEKLIRAFDPCISCSSH